MIKVLILNYEYPPLGGGAGNATYYLLQEYANHPDLNITLVTSSVGKYRREQAAENITIHFLDIGKRGSLHYQRTLDLLRYTWRAWRFCRGLLKQERYDLAHAFFGVPCGLIAWALGLPYIVSLRGSDVPFYNRRFYWLDKLFLKRLSGCIWHNAASVIANSAGLRDLAHQSHPQQPIDVIPNGVDTIAFAPALEKSRSDTLRLISTGRLIERKGYDILIKALEGLEGVELTLIGEGDQAAHLQSLAEQLGVRVNFLGRLPHEDLPTHLQNADIFVLPSHNEGMSNAVLEAMACGLPLILTDTGGVTELLKGNGVVIPKNDISALKQAITRYYLHRNLVHNEGLISLKNAQGMAWDLVSQAYLNLYQQII